MITNRPGSIDDVDAAGTPFWRPLGRFGPKDRRLRGHLDMLIRMGTLKAWRRNRAGVWWVLAYDDWAYRFTTRNQMEAFCLGAFNTYTPDYKGET